METNIRSLLRRDPVDYRGLSFFDLPRAKYDALVAGMVEEHRWHFDNNDAENHLAYLRQWAPGLVEWSDQLPFPKGSVHLDLGAGEGNLSYIVARRGYHSIAVELSATILHSATLFRAGLNGPFSSKNSSMDLWVADIYDLPLKAGSVDFVTIKEVLHHLCDLDDLFREVSRVLKPNGIVYVWEPFYPSFAPLRWYVLTYIRPRELALGIHHVYHSYQTYQQIFDHWLTCVCLHRKYVRTKFRHYVTRNRFYHGSLYAHGRIRAYQPSNGRPAERLEIQPKDFLREELIPTGLKTTCLRKELLDSLLTASLDASNGAISGELQ